MTNLQPITLDDGTTIYIQTQENITVPPIPDDKLDFLTETPTEDADRDLPEAFKRLTGKDQTQALKKTIQGYTKQVIQSFRELALAEVTEVNLEFGVNIGAESGIPYIANGKAECSMNISVKCEFNKKKP